MGGEPVHHHRPGHPADQHSGGPSSWLSGTSRHRRAAVAVTAVTLRGKGRVEAGAENLRPSAGDVVAQARERIGEQVPPPAHPADPAEPHDHDH